MTVGETLAVSGSNVLRFTRRRLSRRLLAWFLAFSLVPLVVTNAVGYFRSRSIIERLDDRYLRALARGQAQQVAARIDRHLLTLQAITAGNEFLAAGAEAYATGRTDGMHAVATPKAITTFLEQKLRDLRAFDAIFLFTPDGRVIASVGEPWDVFASAPGTRAEAHLLVGRVQDGYGAHPHFRLIAPVFGKGPAPLAFLGGVVNLQRFGQFLQVPAFLAGEVESYIVDERGRPLFVSHPPPHGTVDYDAPVGIPMLYSGDVLRRSYTNRAGVEVVGVSAGIPGTGWRFIGEVPAAASMGELRRLGGLSLVAESLLVVALVIAAWLVSRDVVAPLDRLVQATHRVARGDLTTRVEVVEEDEIGALEHAFNEMTGALAHTTQRVGELHQQQIARASQLATVGELAAGVAHEIRNPVVGVSNGLDLVRRRIGHDPTLAPITEEMGRQLLRIEQTVQELLTYARPAPPTLVPVSANSLIDRAVRLVQPAAERAQVSLAVHLDHEAPRFHADEEMLYQALVNVLMNAVQASSAGDHVTVSTRSTDDEVLIEVEDTGCGITEEEQSLVFRPFFTTRHTGTGLGLSITRSMVERHGGTVSLDSRVDVGTTVTIRLPLDPAADPLHEVALA